MIACADFETTTDINDCRVWAYGICEVGNKDNFIYGNNIDDFMKICMDKTENHTFYFHNLKFDGEFIFYWLFRNGYKSVKSRKELEDNSFCTLISDTGQFYSIEVCFKKKGHKTNKVIFFDSLKILNFSVKQIAKGFNLPISKLKLNGGLDKNGNYIEDGYKVFREVGHKLTENEIDYLRNDVEIVSRALKVLFDLQMDKMTIGADALNEYKNVVGKKYFEKNFPTPTPQDDKNIRYSYKGGFTYLNEKYKGKQVKDGLVFDVNSLYPSVMYNCPLPYGEPLYFKGQYKEDKLYNLHVQLFKCQFELKENHIPTIQIKKNRSFIDTEYLKSSGNEEVTLCLTNVDLELFFEHYDVYNIEYIEGYKFKSTTESFKTYIDKWISEKIKAKKEGNLAMFTIAKLMLNTLYGKFALSPNVRSKYPYYDEKEDKVHYCYGEMEERDSIYIPVGTFITAWARYKTITSAQKVYDRFIYADTDSLHLEGLEMPDLDIDDYTLGAWKHESTFIEGKYLRAKSYFEVTIVSDKEYNKMVEDGEGEELKCYYKEGKRVMDKITCAGMPYSCHQFVTLENFEVGASYSGKLQQTRVKGGIVLKDIDFTLKK